MCYRCRGRTDFAEARDNKHSRNASGEFSVWAVSILLQHNCCFLRCEFMLTRSLFNCHLTFYISQGSPMAVIPPTQRVAFSQLLRLTAERLEQQTTQARGVDPFMTMMPLPPMPMPPPVDPVAALVDAPMPVLPACKPYVFLTQCPRLFRRGNSHSLRCQITDQMTI